MFKVFWGCVTTPGRELRLQEDFCNPSDGLGPSDGNWAHIQLNIKLK